MKISSTVQSKPGFSLAGYSWHPNALQLGVIFVYAWLFIHACWLWPSRQLLWGPDSVIAPSVYQDGWLNNIFFRLVYVPQLASTVFFLHLSCAAIAIFSFRGVELFRGVAWLTGCMLYFAAHPAFNSGFLLMLLLAFYCIVIRTRARHSFRIALNNMAWIAVVIQLMLVYAASAWFKLSGNMWTQGSALYYSLHIDQFSNSALIGTFMKQNTTLLMICTYAGLCYQVLFPIVIWIRKWRLPWLVVGICFHLAIGMFLQLWDFATAMLCAYAFLLDEKISGRILSLFNIKTKEWTPS